MMFGKRRRSQIASVFLAGGLLIHISFFKTLHEAADENGRLEADVEQAKLLRGSASDAPLFHVVSQDKQQIAFSDDDGIEGAVKLDESDYLESEDDEPVHLVYASDEGSVPGVVQSVNSVMNYASGPVVFHFVGDSPLPLPPLPNIKFYNITQITKEFKLKDFTNPRVRVEKDRKTLNSNIANYVRFVMDSLLPDVTKAMWVDADTIFKCDVVPMIKNALTESEFAVAAVAAKGKPQSLARWVKKDYSYIKRTFNAGVFVADLDRWREQGLTRQIRELTLSNSKKHIYKYGSQPPLTLVIGNNFEHLNAAWNVKVPLLNKYFKDHGEDAGICLLHWVGGSKPWEGRGQFKLWWNDYELEVNRKVMLQEAEKNRAAKARKWKARVAAKKAARIQAADATEMV